MSLRGIRGIVSNWMNFKRIALAAAAKPPLIFVAGIWMKFFEKIAANPAMELPPQVPETPGEIIKIVLLKLFLDEIAPGKAKMYQVTAGAGERRSSTVRNHY